MTQRTRIPAPTPPAPIARTTRPAVDTPKRRHSWQPDTDPATGDPVPVPAVSLFNFANIPIYPPVQPKLTVGAPDDQYEQEADQVADTVMRMPAPAMPTAPNDEDDPNTVPGVQAKPAGLTITPWVQRQTDTGNPEEDEESVQAQTLLQRQADDDDEEEQEPVQAQALIQRQADTDNDDEKKPIQTKSPDTPKMSPALEAQLNRTQGQGQPLPDRTRAHFEPRFGFDFSKIRIHADGQAAIAAGRLNAQAFTHGRDIYFGAGFYQPHSVAGQRLLAHELTHTVQQAGGRVLPTHPPPRPVIATPSPPAWTLPPRTLVLQRTDDSAMVLPPISRLPPAMLSRQPAGAAATVDEAELETQEDIETLVAWVATKLRVDPDDGRGEVSRRLAGFSPDARAEIMARAGRLVPATPATAPAGPTTDTAAPEAGADDGRPAVTRPAPAPGAPATPTPAVETPALASGPAAAERDSEATTGPEPRAVVSGTVRAPAPGAVSTSRPASGPVPIAPFPTPRPELPDVVAASVGVPTVIEDSGTAGAESARERTGPATTPEASGIEPAPQPTTPRLAAMADAIRAATETEKAAFRQATTMRRVTLQQSVTDTVARIAADRDARTAALIAQIDTRRSEARGFFANIRDEIGRVAEAQRQQATADAEQDIASIPQMAADIRQQALDAAEAEAVEMENYGASEAQRARDQATQTTRRLGEARSSAATGIDRTDTAVVNAVNSALGRVASESIGEVYDNGERTAAAAIDTATQVAASIRSAGLEVANSAQDTSQLERGIRDTAQAVIGQVDGMTQATLARLNESETRIATNLDQAEADLASAIRQLAREATARVQASGLQLLSRLESDETAALAGLDGIAEQAVARLAETGTEGDIPPDRMAAALSEITAGLNQARLGAQADYMIQADQVEDALRQGSQRFSSELAGIAAGIEQRLVLATGELQDVAAIPADIRTHSESMRLEARQTYAEAMQQWMRQSRQPIDEAHAEWQSQRERAGREIRQRVDDYVTETGSMAAQAVSRFATTARDAAADASRSLASRIWSGIVEGLSRFWDGLKDFLIAFVIVFAVVAAVLAAIAGGISLAILGVAAVIALVVVGIGFLIYGLITGLIHRFGQAWELLGDRPWWEKLLIVTLSSPYFLAVVVGDLVGLTPLLEGIFGYDAITFEELSTEERWARATVGVLSILTLALLWRVGRSLGRGRGGRGGEPGRGRSRGGEPAERVPEVREDRPAPVVSPWVELAARYGLRADIVEMMRRSGIEPPVFDRILARGVDAETTALIADYYGRPGIRVLDALSEAGIDTAVAESVIRDAHSLGHLSALADLAESGVATRLIRRGFDSADLALLVDELGVRGVETIDGLMEGAVQRAPAIEAARIAQRIGAVDAVHQLATSGNLENPLGLRDFLREVAAEVAHGQEGKLTQLNEAARRSTSGRVALERSATGEADVIDHATREALQIKLVTSAAMDRVATNVDSAARQLRGEGGEFPPPGYRTIVDVRISNRANPMFLMDAVQLLEALRSEGITQSSLRGVSEVRVTNGTGRHTFVPGDF